MVDASAISQRIDYLRRCLLADRGYTGVSNIYGSRVSHGRLIKGREKLTSGESTEILLPPSFAKKIAANETLYRREKECLYGVFILTGKHDGRLWHTPLLLFPVSFVHDDSNGEYWPLRLNDSGWRINPSLRPLIAEWDAFEKEIRAAITDDKLTWGAAAVVTNLVKKYGLPADLSPMDTYPKLVGKSDLIEASKKQEWTLLPAAWVGLVARSRGVSGILDELKRISRAPSSHLPQTLRCFLGESPVQKDIASMDHRLATTLSRAQKKLLDSSSQSVMTVCHGPPGTGKSYTIACAALAAASRGESVLITSRNDQAVDVVAEKISALSGGKDLIVRAGRSSYLKDLKSYVQSCLSGQAVTDVESDEAFAARRNELNKHEQVLNCLSKDIDHHVQAELKHGELEHLAKPSIFQKIHKSWIGMRLKGQSLKEKHDSYQSYYDTFLKQVAQFLKEERGVSLRRLMKNFKVRSELTRLAKALRKTRSHDQEQAFKEVNFPLLAKALPLWLVNLQDCHRVLPLKKEMFDLVIIDEASQCDMASVLPLLYRAKRFLIMGDPMQLRHISFLSHAFIQEQAKESGIEDRDFLHFRKRSALDVAIDISSVAGSLAFLDEYYRSPRGLISFNNQEYYAGKLRIMQTEIGNATIAQVESKNVSGTRDKGGVNIIEVNAILEWLREHLKQEKHTTIGVLSPFRDQVTALQEALIDAFSPEEFRILTEVYELRLGTPFEFQGDERDVMLLSLVMSDETNALTRRYIEKADVFNVATSRSQKETVVFYSFNPATLPANSVLRRYITHTQDPKENVRLEPQNWSPESLELLAKMRSDYDCVLCEVTVAGIEVDLLLLKEGKLIAMDLIGFPGLVGRAISRDDSHVLKRAKVKYTPITYREWIKTSLHIS